jgi:Flp pilus assembly protein TadB
MLAGVSETPVADEGKPAGKGRPTPKRDEARKRRRAATPTNRKEAAALRRQRLREERTAQRQALITGDERHLPPRDAGPARRMARDVVDGRFTVGQVFFGLVLAVLFLSFVKNSAVQIATNAVMLVLLIAVVLDAVRVGRLAKRKVEEKYGAKDATGITSYATIRALQPRRLRRPPARVTRSSST